jgi:hypothetical protein
MTRRNLLNRRSSMEKDKKNEEKKKKIDENKCSCGHLQSEHTGPGGFCKYNNDIESSCDCDGYIRP